MPSCFGKRDPPAGDSQGRGGREGLAHWRRPSGGNGLARPLHRHISCQSVGGGQCRMLRSLARFRAARAALPAQKPHPARLPAQLQQARRGSLRRSSLRESGNDIHMHRPTAENRTKSFRYILWACQGRCFAAFPAHCPVQLPMAG